MRDAPPKSGPPIHFEVLPNGLTMMLQETHLAPVANLQIWAKVGSADEGPGEAGLAHFHEHMLFKGTEKRGVGEIAGDVEAAGGHINAYTSFDTTVYYATLPAESLPVGLDVLSDAVRCSRFDEDEIAREREVVLEEIRRSADSPGHVLSEATFSTSFRQHPYRAPILGPAENVASFDRARVTRFFKRWYAPDNLVVIAVGAFETEALASEIRGIFGADKAQGAARSRPQEEASSGLRVCVLQRAFEGTRIDMAWRAPRFADRNAALLDLLSYILGECESSRLIRNVRDRAQLVDRIDSSSYTPLDPGLFSVNLETDAANARDAVRTVIEEIEALRAVPVSSAELDRARANFLASEHFERENVSGIASRLGSFHVIGGDYKADVRYLEQIRTATSAELLRVAQSYLRPEALCVAAVVNEQEAGALSEAQIEAAVREGLERSQRRLAAPARLAEAKSNSKSKSKSRPATGSSQLTSISYTLQNGVRLHVRPRREVPVVAIRAAMLGGLLSEDEDSAGITSFLASIWTRGTQARSSADFARSVETIAADINGFSGRSTQGFTVDVTSDQLEPALDLFAEALLEPGFDPEEIERERRETLASIDRRADRLAQLAYMQLAELLFPTHPYRLPMLGHESSVKRIDAASLRAHHERLVRADNLVIGISGDVDPDAVALALSTRLADAASDAFEPPSPPVDAAPTERLEVRLQKERAQAHLIVGFRGLTIEDPDRSVLDVLSQILAGQGGRLFLELRDKQSLAYSVSANSIEGLAPGFFSVYIATANDKVEQAERGIFEELDRVVQQAPSDDELARARRYLCGSFAIDSQRNSNHAAHISLDALYGMGPDAHQLYPEQIAAVTPEDVLRVAQRIITLDAPVVSIVGP